MFIKTDGPHGLPRNPFLSCIVPRPIGWVSSLSADGVFNLAPYSFFNGVAAAPPMVMFASNGRQPHGPKDSVTNIETTGEFVCNLVSEGLSDQMNATSASDSSDTDEFDLAGLETEPSELVKPPRVKASPIHLECAFHGTMELPTDDPKSRNVICIGRVIGIHIRDEVLKNGIIDIESIRPLARLGYRDYTVIEKAISIIRPK